MDKIERDGLTRLTLFLPPELKRAFRMKAYERSEYMSTVLRRLVEEYILDDGDDE